MESWKWPKTTSNIIKTLNKIKITLNSCKYIVSKLKDESSELSSELNSYEDSPYINNVGDRFCEDDACQMARELTKTMNTTFTVRNVSASELREGDIVQYLSHGNYPRYLVVQKIIKTPNNNSRQLLDTTPTDVPIGFLKSTGDKLVEIPLIGEVICLKTPNGMDTYDALQGTVKIQQNNIKNDKKYAEKIEKKAERMHTAMVAFEWITGITLITAICVAAAAIVTGIVTPVASVLWSVTMIVGGTDITLLSITLFLYSAYNDLKWKLRI